MSKILDLNPEPPRVNLTQEQFDSFEDLKCINCDSTSFIPSTSFKIVPPLVMGNMTKQLMPVQGDMFCLHCQTPFSEIVNSLYGDTQQD